MTEKPDTRPVVENLGNVSTYEPEVGPEYFNEAGHVHYQTPVLSD